MFLGVGFTDLFELAVIVYVVWFRCLTVALLGVHWLCC